MGNKSRLGIILSPPNSCETRTPWGPYIPKNESWFLTMDENQVEDKEWMTTYWNVSKNEDVWGQWHWYLDHCSSHDLKWALTQGLLILLGKEEASKVAWASWKSFRKQQSSAWGLCSCELPIETGVGPGSVTCFWEGEASLIFRVMYLMTLNKHIRTPDKTSTTPINTYHWASYLVAGISTCFNTEN